MDGGQWAISWLGRGWLGVVRPEVCDFGVDEGGMMDLGR